MTPLRFLLLLALVATPRLPAADAQGDAPADALAKAETLPTESLSPAWRARLAALAAPPTVTAEFTEQRFTPLKKLPVSATGVVRIDRERGLSLAYSQKRAPVVILDERGLLLRFPDGREQAAPAEAEADLRLLHALFAFDLATLGKAYSIAATDNPDATWSLTFTRLPDNSAGYRELTLSGDASRLTFIRLTKSSRNRTEITLATPVLDRVFTAEDLARFFR